MATNKGKDSGPEGHKKLATFDGSDEVDVEGHIRRMPRDAEPEGMKKLPKFDGAEDDDVEGHKQQPK